MLGRVFVGLALIAALLPIALGVIGLFDEVTGRRDHGPDNVQFSSISLILGSFLLWVGFRVAHRLRLRARLPQSN
jgi:hypothetical protein